MCATKLGDGAALYLQTMKTMMIMMMLLSFVNLPILLMYQSNTVYNNYLDLYSSTFRFYTLGNMGITNDKCGYSRMNYESDHDHARRLFEQKELELKCPENTYINEIKHFGLLYL
mmetsp:Transcript_5131/g.7850  ORF Transcript_5131/g.7850 Transcript_5131/m.7850 type:complete len:115 (+) Transcript_5131:2231-2575(+)